MAETLALAAPQKVLVFSTSWLPGQVDGVAVRMMAHVKELVARGCKVYVVTPDFAPLGEATEARQPHFIPGVEEHIVLETQRVPVYRKVLCMRYSIANFQTLVETIRRVQPDIVHGTQEASMQMLAAACLICDVPLVISVHTDVAQIAARDKEFSPLGGNMIGRIHAWIAVAFTNWGYRNWALSGATYFSVSRQAKKFLGDAGVPECQIAPTAWGPMVDREQFRIDLPRDRVAEERQRLTFGIEGAYLMVYVGRVTAEKDVQFLVDALDRAPKNVVLALIGSGSMAAELKKRHGREQRLHCTGDFVNREQVALALRAADCCVSASTMETIGFSAMEALSCGTPMLAARAQGFAEHLEHGKNARLWEPLNPASFDHELAELMKADGPEWSRESLRASMEWASLKGCTENALRAYEVTTHANKRALRLVPTLFYLFLNWFFGFFVQ